MIRYVFASLLICVCACSRQHGGSRRQGPMVAVPEFTIRIALTEAAARGLSEAGETIRGSVFFVNVYSGRRVFPNNVLRGGLCEG